MKKRQAFESILGMVILSVGLLIFGQQENPLLWGPVLGAIGDDFVAMSWNTSRPVGTDVRYSTAAHYEATGGWEDTLSFAPHSGIAEIRLGDLAPATAYRYQLVIYEGDAVYESPIGRFTTAGPDLSHFSFLVYGGTSTLPDRHKFVASVMNRNEPDAAFVVNVGEIVEEPSTVRFQNLFWAADGLVRDHPYLVVPDDRIGEDPLYYDVFPLPAGGGEKNEEWWSFDYGDVHLIGLDATATGDTLQAETEWLRADLAGSNAAFIVVFTYRPIYSSSLTGGADTALRDAWVPLFHEYGVRLVMSGQVHAYEHLYVDGIHYLVTGGGGAPLDAVPETTASGTVFRRYGMLHYIRVTAAGGIMRVEVIPVGSVYDGKVHLSPEGRPIDSFTLGER